MVDFGAMTGRALSTALWIALPLLGAALGVAVFIGFLQIIARAQDATVASLARALVVAGLLVVLAPWVQAQLVGFTTTLYQLLPELAR